VIPISVYAAGVQIRRDTVKVRRLPQVGVEIMIKVRVTRVTDDKLTVMIPANGHLTTATAEQLLPDDSDG
jgi:hypothetical protein